MGNWGSKPTRPRPRPAAVPEANPIRRLQNLRRKHEAHIERQKAFDRDRTLPLLPLPPRPTAVPDLHLYHEGVRKEYQAYIEEQRTLDRRNRTLPPPPLPPRQTVDPGLRLYHEDVRREYQAYLEEQRVLDQRRESPPPSPRPTVVPEVDDCDLDLETEYLEHIERQSIPTGDQDLERQRDLGCQRIVLGQAGQFDRILGAAAVVSRNLDVLAQNAAVTPASPPALEIPIIDQQPPTSYSSSSNTRSRNEDVASAGPSKRGSRFVPKVERVQNTKPRVAPDRVENPHTTTLQAVNHEKKIPHCRPWKVGNCRLGDKCRFLHDPEVQEAEQARLAQLAENEATQTVDHVILSSTVTFASGISVVRFATSLDSSLVSIKNLPASATKLQVAAVFSQPGFTRFTVTGLRQCNDGRQEATVSFEDPQTAALAVAGLDETEFGIETLKLEIVSKETGMGGGAGDSTVVNLTWPVPSMGVVATYGTMEEARSKAKELDRQSSCGRRIRAAMNTRPPKLPEIYFNPASVLLSGFPVGTDLGVITQLAGSNMIKPLKSRHYNMSDAVDAFRDYLHTHGSGLASFELQTTAEQSPMVLAKARFDTWEHAKQASQFVENKPLHFLGGAKCYASVLDPLCYTKSMAFEQFKALEPMFKAIGSGAADGARVRLIEGKPGSQWNCRVQVSGSDKKAVGTLKVRVEQLVNGERLEHWDREFFSRDGTAFLRSVFKSTNAYVRCDGRSNSLKVFGEPRAVERAKEMIKDECERLASLEFTFNLKRVSVRFFVRQGVGRLAAIVGEGNVKLDVNSPPNYRITVRGGGEAVKQILRTLIDESFAPRSANKPKSDETCPVCFDDIDDPLRLGCGHAYCNSCIRHFITTAKDTKSFPLACMAQVDDHSCGTPISISIIQRFLLPAQFNQLLEVSFQDYLDRHPREFKYCITPDCPQIYRMDMGRDIVQCPSCFATTCLSCSEDHEGFSCQEWKLHRDPAAQEQLLQDWAADSGVKKCPSCGVMIEKDGGCNHMSCKCGAHICWVCMGVFTYDLIYPHMTLAHGGFGL